MDNNIFVLLPVILPLVGAILALLTVGNNRLQRFIGVLAIGFACVSSYVVLQTVLENGPQMYAFGNWEPPYGIVLVTDSLNGLFGVMTSTILFAGVLYIYDCRDKCMTYPVFMPLTLVMAGGLNGAMYTGDIFTLFVFIELMVISSVVLVSIADSPEGLEAAMKYLLISAMGSLFLLIGIASIYATFGTLNFADLARLLSLGQRPVLAQASAVMLIAAFLLKSAVFPFHFWQPDFHTTAPTPLSALLSSVVVKVGIYGLIRIVTLLFREESQNIEALLVILGIIGVFFGSLSAMRTYNAKRMLAYSTFGQIGFILIAIGWGTPTALAAAIIYAFNHAFIKSSLLMLTGAVASYTKTKTSNFVDLTGVGKAMGLASLLYFLGAMALSGLPPMNGFISKLSLIQGGVSAQSWVWLGLAVGGGLLTLIYTMRAWQLMFQQAPDDTTAELKSEGDSFLAPALLIAACVLLGLYAAPLVNLANSIVTQIGDPSIYINAVLR